MATKQDRPPDETAQTATKFTDRTAFTYQSQSILHTDIIS